MDFDVCRRGSFQVMSSFNRSFIQSPIFEVFGVQWEGRGMTKGTPKL